MANKGFIIKAVISSLVGLGIAKVFSAAKNFSNNFIVNVQNYRIHKITGTTIETIADISMLNANNLGTTIKNLFVRIQYQDNNNWFDLAVSPVLISSLNIIPNKEFRTSVKLNYNLFSFPFGLLKPLSLGQIINIKIVSKFEIAGVTQTVENIMPLQVPSAFTSLVKVLFPNLKGLSGPLAAIKEAPKQVTDSNVVKPTVSITKYL